MGTLPGTVTMNDLLVIGGPSLDLLHLANGSFETAGGAGLYTALAAHRCGASVTLLAPRPEPCPPPLKPLADRLTAWHGPLLLPPIYPTSKSPTQTAVPNIANPPLVASPSSRPTYCQPISVTLPSSMSPPWAIQCGSWPFWGLAASAGCDDCRPEPTSSSSSSRLMLRGK